MDAILAGLQWSSCLVYLDDNIIPEGNFQAHLSNLQAVFARLHKAGLKLKQQKCRPCVHKVNYLGHVVSKNGVHTDKQRTERVSSWPVPVSKWEVQQS